MLRHPPSNNQLIISEFLKRGYHDALVNRLSQSLHERWTLLGDLLDQRLPGSSKRPTFGGSAFWIEGPPSLDATALAAKAARSGLLFEPGEVFFHGDNPPRHFFRMGFSSIRTKSIEPGIECLLKLLD